MPLEFGALRRRQRAVGERGELRRALATALRRAGQAQLAAQAQACARDQRSDQRGVCIERERDLVVRAPLEVAQCEGHALPRSQALIGGCDLARVLAANGIEPGRAPVRVPFVGERTRARREVCGHVEPVPPALGQGRQSAHERRLDE